MNTRLTANLSVFSTFALLLLSFSFGFHSYSKTEEAIVSDLNQALQRTIMQKSNLWMSQDTLQTYSRLSTVFGNPIYIESYNKEFSEALNFSEIKEKTGIIVQVKNKKETANPLPVTNKKLADNYLASDTVIWISATPKANTQLEDIGISFQGYANCSPFIILTLMNKTFPLLFLFLAFISAAGFIYLHRYKSMSCHENKNTVVYGNLILSCDKASFYKKDGEKLKLTPQQYELMEMFFRSSTHILSRSEICEALWPGKINADETLNTLIRRLRPLIEDNTNLKITTDRGRAYVLEETLV
ncbi:helix-turn-helix domain-containing protein [Parabacteroides sp. AM08-6]|nr:helix-turn-helix domain-containing protein [Parabacteroides sp. AM08-6]